MQFIAEAHDLLRGAGLEPTPIAEVFREWNTGDLDSFLIQITAEVLAHVDAATGRPFVDVVADAAEQLGTGRRTVQSGLELGVPTNAIAGAVFAPSASGHAGLRAAARSDLSGPDGERSRTPSSWSRTSGRRCGPPRSSPMRRGSTSSAPPATPTTGAWTWPRWPGSGGPAASSGPACWSTSARRTATPTSRPCWPPPTSPRSSGSPRTAGAGRSRSRRPEGPRPRLRLGAGLLRHRAARSAAGGAAPAAAGLLRRPHLPAREPRGGLPHAVVGGPDRAGGLSTCRRQTRAQTGTRLSAPPIRRAFGSSDARSGSGRRCRHRHDRGQRRGRRRGGRRDDGQDGRGWPAGHGSRPLGAMRSPGGQAAGLRRLAGAAPAHRHTRPPDGAAGEAPVVPRAAA
jgi:6-phosphogluconate dehydrogenase, C-terminal domain